MKAAASIRDAAGEAVHAEAGLRRGIKGIEAAAVGVRSAMWFIEQAELQTIPSAYSNHIL